MLRNTILLVVLASTFNTIAFSQESSGKYYSIGLIPTYLLDPITPSIGVSIEHSIAKNLNGEIIYGYDPNISFLNWHKDIGSRHHEYRALCKYIFNRNGQEKIYTYLGAEYYGVYNKYNREDSWYREGGISYDYDKAKVIRIVNGFRLNGGIKFKLLREIWVDAFLAIGRKYENIRYFPENRTESQDSPWDEWLTPFDRNARKVWGFTMAFGIKLAYRFY